MDETIDASAHRPRAAQAAGLAAELALTFPHAIVPMSPAYALRECDGRWHVIPASYAAHQPIATANAFRDQSREELALLVRKANAARPLAAVVRLLLAAMIAHEAEHPDAPLRGALETITNVARQSLKDLDL